MSTYKIQIKNSSNINIGDQLNSRIRDFGTEDKLKMLRDQQMNECERKYAHIESLLRKDIHDSIKECFMDVKLRKLERSGTSAEETILLRDIFSEDVHRHNTVLITGESGFGKTTLCKKLAYDWGANESYLRNFDIVIFVELANKKVSEAITDVFGKNSKFNTRELNILFILDGFDEISDKPGIWKFITKDSIQISEKNTIIITSRPHCADEIRNSIRLHYCIEEYSSEQKEKYIKTTIKRDNNRKQHLINLIRDDNFYYELTNCPLMLSLLCFFPDNEWYKKIKTKTDLFVQILHYITEKFKINRGEFRNIKEGNHFFGEDVLVKLGKFYYEKQLHTFQQLSISDDRKARGILNFDLKKNLSNEEYKVVIGLDIVNHYIDESGEMYSEFVHTCFTDFAVACYCCHFIASINIPSKSEILLFLFGLLREVKYPQSLVTSLTTTIFPPLSWADVYKEIKDERNRELFCNKTKLLIYFNELNELKKLLAEFPLKQICLTVPHSEHDYKIFREKLIKFHMEHKDSGMFDVYLLLGIQSSDVPFLGLHDEYKDIRKYVEFVKDLLSTYEWNKFTLHFYAVLRTNEKHSIIRKKEIDTFNSVKQHTDIHLKDSDDYIEQNKVSALVSCSETDKKNIKYLISLEQFKFLEKYLIIDFEAHKKDFDTDLC